MNARPSRRAVFSSIPHPLIPRRTVRAFLLAALALAAFALTATLLRAAAPRPEMGSLDDKLAWLERHGDRVDVLFVGSSRVLRGVVPEVFEAELARLGHPLTAFNLGTDGMEMHEANAVVRRVLAGRPERLRWVVVELDGWTTALRAENRYTARLVEWHDLPETLAVVGEIAAAEAEDGAEPPLAERLELAGSHLLHLAARATAAGRGRDAAAVAADRLVRGSAGAGPDGGTAPTLDRERGFEPFSAAAYRTPSPHPFRSRFLELVPVYRRAVARLPEANRAEVSVSEADLRGVRRQAAMIRRAGATPVHLITPTARPTPELYRLAASGAVPALLAFNRPEEYPELFDLEHRFDAEHLSTAGARAFSRHLARRFAAEVLAGARATELAAGPAPPAGGGR